MRLLTALRRLRKSVPLGETAAALAAALAVVAAHLGLARLRQPRPVLGPEPPALARPISDVHLHGTFRECVAQLSDASSVKLVLCPEDLDPRRSRGLFADSPSHRPDDWADRASVPAPASQLDMRLRGVTLGQSLALLYELVGYDLGGEEQPDGSVVIGPGEEAPTPPAAVVRMHDLGGLVAEDVRFTSAFAGRAFGPAAGVRGDKATRAARERVQALIDLHIRVPASLGWNSRWAGDCLVQLASPELHDDIDKFLAALEVPRPLHWPPGAGVPAGPAADAKGGPP